MDELTALIDQYAAGDRSNYCKLAWALTRLGEASGPLPAVLRHGKLYTAHDGRVIVRRLVDLENET